MKIICGYPVISREVISQNGCYSRERFWIDGWQKNLQGEGCVKYVRGWNGEPQTLIEKDIIRATHTFEVYDEKSEEKAA